MDSTQQEIVNEIKASMAPKSRKPLSSSLFIRAWLRRHEEACIWDMFDEYKKLLIELNPTYHMPSYPYFRVVIYTLRKRGLIENTRTEPPIKRISPLQFDRQYVKITHDDESTNDLWRSPIESFRGTKQ